MRRSPLALALFIASCASACPVDVNDALDDHDRALGDSDVVPPLGEGGEGEEGEGEEGEGEVDPVPAGWTCADSYYDDSDCDCGCGVRDPTCAAGTGCTAAGCFDEACDFCFVAGGEIGACVDPALPRCGDCSVDSDCQSGNCRTYVGQLDDDAVCMVGCSSDAQCQATETCTSGLCVAARFSDVRCADADTLVRVDTACDRPLRFACAENSLCACTLSEGPGSPCEQATCRAHCQACTDSSQCPAGDGCRFFTGFEAQGAVCSAPCVTDADCGSLGRCLTGGFCGDLGANRCAGNSVVRDDQCGRALLVQTCGSGCSGGACNP